MRTFISTLTFLLTVSSLSLYAGQEAQAPAKNSKVCLAGTEAAKLVNQWFNQGTAAGNKGDYYDNRDRGHSMLRVKNYPQLSLHKYTRAQLARRMDWAATGEVRPYVTMGNSSTSSSPTRGGSNPRQMYSSSRGLQQLYLQYRGNNVYIYPEHLDHDPGHNGRGGYGDLFPTNSPYLIISQGSSGSDRVFMDAVLLTLAAFRPEVKRILTARGLLMPTIQMILRMSNRNITNPDAYLSGRAHPTVFNGKLLNPTAMVKRAHAITPDTIPPLVSLRVVTEDQPSDIYCKDSLNRSEQLGDTPHVIARIHRRLDYKKRIVLSAAKSTDINNRKLTFFWKLLRGDAKLVRIKTSDNGRVAEITVAYHGRRPIAAGSAQESNRVDIGVFAFNGKSYSAPSFYTILYLDNERRTYAPDGRLLEAWYNAGDTRIGYTSDKWPVIGDKYDIFDWNALFAFLQRRPDDFAGRLLCSRFTDEQLSVIAETAAEFKRSYGKYTASKTRLEKELKQAQEAVKAARDRVAACKKALQQATATVKQNPSPETKAALTKARAGLAAAEKELKPLQRKVSVIRRNTRNSIWDAQRIIEKQNPALGTSVKAMVEDSLSAIKNDLRLYCRNPREIDQLASARADKRTKAEFGGQLRDLLKLGLLQRNADQSPAIRPAVPGTVEPLNRLTAYEKYALQRFNLTIMNRLLYPGFMRCTPTVNYVDQRLTVVRPWRDLYRYGRDAQFLGWTRYTGDVKSIYTRQGYLVLEQDKLGRPLVAEAVRSILTITYTDSRNKHRLAGRVEYDGHSCSVYTADNTRIIDSAGKGKGVRPGQIQFLVFEGYDRPPRAPSGRVRYVIDLNHYDKTGYQTGWTRYDNGKVYEFVRKGKSNAFVGRDAAGREVKDPKLKYMVPGSKAKVKIVPTGTKYRYRYKSDKDQVGRVS